MIKTLLKYSAPSLCTFLTALLIISCVPQKTSTIKPQFDNVVPGTPKIVIFSELSDLESSRYAHKRYYGSVLTSLEVKGQYYTTLLNPKNFTFSQLKDYLNRTDYNQINFDYILSLRFINEKGTNSNIDLIEYDLVDSKNKKSYNSRISVSGMNGLKMVDILFIEIENYFPKQQQQKQYAEVPPPQQPKKIENTVRSPDPPQLDKIQLGDFYAVVIGNTDYKYLADIHSAATDAKSISDLLTDMYGYKTSLLIDATRSEILLALNKMRKLLSDKDNLLIYYSGHGKIDNSTKEGYWVPVDAKPDSDIKWISNASITSKLKAIDAKHILVVADSCYTGKLTRGLKIQQKTWNYYSRVSEKRGRSVITSGNLSPSDSDSAGKVTSPFASAFINILAKNESIIDSTELYREMKKNLINSASRIPEYADIRKAGHDGGEFLFQRMRRH